MTAELSMPVIATYGEISDYLKLSRKTVYKMVCEKRFRPGIYIGQGRFNMSRLRDDIEKRGSYLRDGHKWN